MKQYYEGQDKEDQATWAEFKHFFVDLEQDFKELGDPTQPPQSTEPNPDSSWLQLDSDE